MTHIPANLDKDERRHLNNVWAPNFDHLDMNRTTRGLTKKAKKGNNTSEINFCKEKFT